MLDRFALVIAVCAFLVVLSGCEPSRPLIGVNPLSVSLTPDSPDATVTVWNRGTGNLRWFVDSNDSAVTVTPSESIGSRAQVTITGSDFTESYIATLTFINRDLPLDTVALAVSVNASAGCDDCPTETFMLPGDVPLVMVVIPAGTFSMGSTSGGDDERPVHEVTISQDFQLGQVEVTQAQWEAVMGMGSNPSNFSGPDRPVEKVSWNDAQAFIAALNSLTGETFRLPTEAEWEYACRAGTTTEYHFGESFSGAENYAWNMLNSGGEAQDVGQKLPNEFGLYDMNGNVWEWCNDWYGMNYYSISPNTDPTGPETGGARVARGGSWHNPAEYARSALRWWFDATYAFDTIGFRLAK